jgi:outer membrane protein OmpA-like peptidoglycan-associated protein
MLDKRTLLLSIILLLSPISRAAEGINAQNFLFSQSLKTLVVEDALRSDGEFNLSRPLMWRANYSFVDDPLLEVNPSSTSQTGRVVQSLSALDLGGTYYIRSKYSLGFSTSFNRVKTINGNDSSIGDSWLSLKYRFSERSDQAWAVMPFINLPTGQEKYFTSDGSLGGGFLFIFEKNYHILDLFVNLGYSYNNDAKFRNINLRNRVISQLGVNIHLWEKIDLNLEWKSQFGMPLDSNQNPAEIYGGVLYKASRYTNLFAGVGLGGYDFSGSNNTHSNDVRVYAGIKWLPKLNKTKILEVERVRREIITKKLIVLQGIKFRTGSEALTGHSDELLDDVAKTLKANIDFIKFIYVDGHTDTLGKEAFNKELSLKRAETVRTYLVKKGVTAGKVQARGFGEEKPLVLEKDKSTRRKNRRVEFSIIYE